MIKFFRNIRQNLLNEGKTANYLKYAIGEIVLVVIGILIALQVNNWNQKRIDNQTEILLLKELHAEFVGNKKQLQEVLEAHQKAIKSTRYVISKFPIDPNKINLDSFWLNMRGWPTRYTFNPSQGVIRSLINSSSFNIISDQELRKLLISWEDVLSDYQEEEDIASSDLRNYIVPKYLDHIPFGEGLTYKPFDKSFLASFEFENIFYYWENDLKDILESTDSELEKIKETINKIIELSDTENQ
jgi:hypothetical protein